MRHGLKQLCDTGNILKEIVANGLKGKPKCTNSMKPNKKKKKKRKCREDEPEGDNCIKATSLSTNGQQQGTKLQNSINKNNNKKEKVSNPIPNAAQNKKCVTEDCKLNKKKKNNNNNNSQVKSNPNGGNNNAKGPKGKKKSTTKLTTTPKPEEEELDGRFEALTSDEIEFEEDYDEFNASVGKETSNLVDDENDEYAN